MSYSVQVRGTDTVGASSYLNVTVYSGGTQGRMVQLTIGREFVALDREQVADLLTVLWRVWRRSLAAWPETN